MKTHQLIAGAAAVLLTLASLRAVTYRVNVPSMIRNSVSTPVLRVTDLSPVMVHPSPAEKREAALIHDTTGVGLITLPVDAGIRADASIQPLGLLGSQLVMPYYSFGRKFGRITKE